jgi:hypothetical protein
MFGEFAVMADRKCSRDFNRKFPAEGLLRALAFENAKPIKVGASLGQSLQAIRFLTAQDERVLDAAAGRINEQNGAVLDTPFGLWTKCDAIFANYFLRNWSARHEPLAFLLYDSPPVLPSGTPVFIHSDKNLRIVASFRESQFIAGYKPNVEADERVSERERVWQTYRQRTINPPAKSDFDRFWDAQHGVRALFLMENLVEVPKPVPFKSYGRALEWGYPMGVGYRYLSLSQSLLMLRAAELPDLVRQTYFSMFL